MLVIESFITAEMKQGQGCVGTLGYKWSVPGQVITTLARQSLLQLSSAPFPQSISIAFPFSIRKRAPSFYRARARSWTEGRLSNALYGWKNRVSTLSMSSEDPQIEINLTRMVRQPNPLYDQHAFHELLRRMLRLDPARFGRPILT